VNLTFVVGTGRCGSTLLSRILHEHSEVLSLSELFSMLKGSLRRREFPAGEMDGRELWGILSASDRFADARIRDGLITPEMGYPYGSGRFDPSTGVPLICHNLLPLLSDDPDALFDKLEAEVVTWPKRPAGDQYRALFGFLSDLLDRPVVVERSGASLTVVSALRRQFPEARFVHMYRDGPDCALSMLRHPVFRLTGMIAEAARACGLLDGSSSWEEIEAEVDRLARAGKVPETFNGLIRWPFDTQRYMNYPIPPAFFGELWSDLICAGIADLSELPPEQRTSMAYEDLLRDPQAELTRLAEFIGVPARSRWLRTSASLIDGPSSSSAAARLDPRELAALREACEPGAAALAAALPAEDRAGSA
jgi:hypothetical protein